MAGSCAQRQVAGDCQTSAIIADGIRTADDRSWSGAQDPAIGLRFVELGDELERALGRWVELVSRRAIKPSLWQQIEAELIDA
jgi:hypothetical protein